MLATEAGYHDELLRMCDEYAKLENEIDTALNSMELDMNALMEVSNEMEHLMSIEASAANLEERVGPDKRYSIAGATKLRWLLDGEGAPIFDKLDIEVASRYRRKLLQYYHPDRGTGDRTRFNLVNKAVATSNIEMLALLALGIGQEVDEGDIKRYHGTAYRRLSRMKAGLSFRALCMCRTGNAESAQELVQREIDKRANLMRIAILNRKVNREKE